jgi:hypothetical protein
MPIKQQCFPNGFSVDAESLSVMLAGAKVTDSQGYRPVSEARLAGHGDL